MRFTPTPKYSETNHDSKSQRPLVWGLIRSFFFGMLAALGALFSQMLVSLFFAGPQDLDGLFFSQMTPLLAVASLLEEIFIFIFSYENFREIKTVSRKEITYNSVLLGLGFSFVELFFTFSGLSGEMDNLSFALPFLGIILIHIATASIIGYSLAKARTINLAFIARTISAVFLIHLIYNSLVIYNVL